MKYYLSLSGYIRSLKPEFTGDAGLRQSPYFDTKEELEGWLISNGVRYSE